MLQMSSKARKLNKKYELQTQKRDQDLFGMYIYNDFTGYGLQEVIENQLSAFNDEFTSDMPSPFTLWYMIESLAWWFNNSDMMLWNSIFAKKSSTITLANSVTVIDDSRRVFETLQIVGLTFLSTLNMLEQANLLENDSVIPNISLVLSLILGFLGGFAESMSLRGKGQDWPNAITAYAEKHGINIKGKYGITGKHYRVSRLSTKKRALVEKAASIDKWMFKQQYKEFSATYGNGGVEYDITKMSKAERSANAFDKKDPLDETHPISSEGELTDADETFPEIGRAEDEGD